jgi:hypothetical protein
MPVPPPYKEIADLLRQGQVIPFLGAGASLGNRGPAEAWDVESSKFTPRGDELSRWLADVINFPSVDPYDLSNLAKVSSYFAEISGRDRLLARLREVFCKTYAPSDIHLYLAELAKSAEIAQTARAELREEYKPAWADKFRPLLIVTTNYDVMTESALRDLNCAYDLVVHPTEQTERAGSVMWWKHGACEAEWLRPNDLAIDLNATTVVYKMHGSVLDQTYDTDSYVITEEDYVEFLSLMAVPPLFTSHFYSRQFLFIGYGLADWNFRVMLKNLREKPRSTDTPGKLEHDHPAPVSQRKKLKSWALQKQPSQFEDVLWDARDVALMDEDINDFTRKLRKYSQTLINHIDCQRYE